MKKILLFLVIVLGALAGYMYFFKGSCHVKDSKTVAESSAAEDVILISDGIKNVNIDDTELEWQGKKVLIDSYHQGSIKLKSGTLNFSGGELKMGEFAVDMSTIEVTDIEDEESRSKLKGHLESEDFFAVGQFPLSNFRSKEVVLKSKNLYLVSGDMTIRGITKPYDFELSISDSNTAIAELAIDRTEFSVNYNSESLLGQIGDKVISNTITLNIKLKF
ncbi:YceI family protein [Ichthyobacterium seriolicida]|uniref:Lipid-binding protein n=1 Tax=Ichthyobacterium seriolicida TaxID=242600 RepID=A0A1J1EC19_9FLAO|nr:YceI family protein [Ichthyobacterium seriolicida]BAV95056.1 lipid-binding protein [Ichthyobacterium seriolicida]